MSTTISTRPRGLSWSRNPIRHVFSHVFAPADSRLSLQLQDDSNNILTEVLYPIKTGSFTSSAPYLNELMDPFLTYTRPSLLTPGVGAQVLEETTSNIKGFKVRYAETQVGVSPSYTQDSTITKVIKGGIGDMNFLAAAALNDGGHATPIALPANGQFLTNVPGGRMQRPDEWGWILYLCLANNATRNAVYQVLYNDGTSASFTRAFPNPGSGDTTHRNWYIPTGIDQCGLDPLGKGVQSYTLSVFVGSGFPPTLEGAYSFVIDNRKYYHPLTIYYRNSLGGWDNLSLRGHNEHSSDVDRLEYARDINNSTNGMAMWFNTSIRPKWKGFTSYLSAAHLTALQDLMLSAECAFLNNAQWLPIRITSKTLTHFDSRNGLHSAAIEFETAGSFNSFPRQLPSLL